MLRLFVLALMIILFMYYKLKISIYLLEALQFLTIVFLSFFFFNIAYNILTIILSFFIAYVYMYIGDEGLSFSFVP